ncbi:hypothetical protein HK405_012303 [Cladochytrium tenue]|nr:hypothetical protein HK405_012303 [Cladochytrium tenue]
MPAATIEDTLRKAGMHDFDVPWTVVPTLVISGDGLWDSLAWLQDEKDKLAREEEGEARAAAAASSADSVIHGLAAGFSWLWRPAPDTQPTLASSKAAAASQCSSLALAYPRLLSLDELAALVVAPSDHDLLAAEFRNRFARGELDPSTTTLTSARATFTISIFWCTVLQHAISSEHHTRVAQAAPDLDDDSFPEFLAAQSHVIYSGLWRRYYSQAVLMSRDAASRFVVPDLHPLPTYALFRENEIAWANEDTATFSAWPRGDLEEAEDEELLQRIIYFSVRKGVLRGVHRGKIVKDLVDDLKASGERAGCRYPETHVYLTHHGSVHRDFRHAAHAAFLPPVQGRLPDLCDLHAWRPYYSEALWTSAAARDAFVPPDLRDRLPDTVELDSTIDSRLKTAIASAMAAKAVGGDRKTPTAAQGELQENFMALLADYDAEVMRRPSAGGNTGDGHSNSNDDDDRFLAAVADGKLAAPGLHHGRLLRFIFLHLTRVRRRGEPARVATSHIVDGLNDYFKATYLIHLTDPDGHAAAAAPTNAVGSTPRPPLQPPSLRPVAIHPGTTRLFF